MRIRFVTLHCCAVLLLLLPCAFKAQPTTTSLVIEQYMDRLGMNAQGVPLASSLAIPPLQHIELRSKSDQFQLKNQSLELRFSLYNRKERRAIRHILTSLNDEERAFETGKMNEWLKTIYEYLIDWNIYSKELGLLQKELLVLEDKKAVIYKMLAGGEMHNLSEWMKLNNQISTLKFKILTLQDKINQRKAFLNENGISGREIQFEDWITIEQIQEKLSTLDSPIHNEFPKSKLTAMELNTSLAQLELQRASSSKWIDFLQFSYSGYGENDLQKAVTVGVGIRLPFGMDEKIKSHELALKHKRQQIESEDYAIKVKEIIRQSRTTLDELFKGYQYEIEEDKEGSMTKILKQYQSNSAVSPLLLLDIELQILDEKRRLLEYDYDIHKAYIQYLYWTGRLVRAPIKNYLSSFWFELDF